MCGIYLLEDNSRNTWRDFNEDTRELDGMPNLLPHFASSSEIAQSVENENENPEKGFLGNRKILL